MISDDELMTVNSLIVLAVKGIKVVTRDGLVLSDKLKEMDEK